MSGRLDNRAGAFDLDLESAVVRVDATCTWKDLEARLHQNEMTVGPLPRWLVGESIAEIFQREWVSRPSPFYGPLRESVLGVEIQTKDGIARCPVAPRRAMGPDLPRVAYGRSDLTGPISGLALQVWSRPKRTRQLGIVGSDWAAAQALGSAWLDLGLRPAWWCFTQWKGGIALLAEVEERAIPLSQWDEWLSPAGWAPIDPGEVTDWVEAHFGQGQARQPSPVSISREGHTLIDGMVGYPQAEVWDLRAEGLTLFVDTPQASENQTDDWGEAERSLRERLEARG